MLRMYSLDTFADGSPISDDFKHKLEQDFKVAKEAGWSLVLRFMYENVSKMYTFLIYIWLREGGNSKVWHDLEWR